MVGRSKNGLNNRIFSYGSSGLVLRYSIDIIRSPCPPQHDGCCGGRASRPLLITSEMNSRLPPPAAPPARSSGAALVSTFDNVPT